MHSTTKINNTVQDLVLFWAFFPLVIETGSTSGVVYYIRFSDKLSCNIEVLRLYKLNNKSEPDQITKGWGKNTKSINQNGGQWMVRNAYLIIHLWSIILPATFVYSTS